MSKHHSTHRWTGWPGAICQDCGIEDQLELCVAEHDIALTCIYGHMQCQEHPMQRCSEHVNPPCPGKSE